MKELTLEQMETTQGGKFWGKGNCRTKEGGAIEYYEHNGGAWDCRQEWTCDYFAFWFKVARDLDEWGGCIH